MYLFPYSCVRHGMKIIIYGAGNIGKQYVRQLECTSYCDVICIADRSSSNRVFGKAKVLTPDRIDFSCADAVVIAIENSDVAASVREFLAGKGIENIVWDIIPYDGEEFYSHQKEYVSYSLDKETSHSRRLSEEKIHDVKKMLNAMKVKRYENMNLIRVGGNADGGYVMVDNLSGSIAYSIGIGDEISWDKDMADRGYDLYMYDFSVDKIPFFDERFHFFKYGISGSKTDDPSFLTLDEAIESNDHNGKSGMILKMDIEGGEWGFFERVDEKILSQFDQLVFEIHGLLKTGRWAYYAECLGRLGRTHSLIHVHANNYSRYALINRLRISDCMELTYVKNGDREFEFNDSTFPIMEDRPNIAGLDETDLGRWNNLIDSINSF